MTPVITADHLTIRFGDFTAVNDVSFDINKGELFGFLGPNGSGKTTIIKALCGLITPTEGTGTILTVWDASAKMPPTSSAISATCRKIRPLRRPHRLREPSASTPAFTALPVPRATQRIQEISRPHRPRNPIFIAESTPFPEAGSSRLALGCGHHPLARGRLPR